MNFTDFQLTLDIYLLLACILFWAGRMSRATKPPIVQYNDVYRDRKVETPIYKCEKDCVIKLTHQLYNAIVVNDASADDISQQIEMEKGHLETMKTCHEIAKQVHGINTV